MTIKQRAQNLITEYNRFAKRCENDEYTEVSELWELADKLKIYLQSFINAPAPTQSCIYNHDHAANPFDCVRQN